MGLATREIEINGRRFKVTQLPGMKSLRMSARLARIFGPALARLATASQNPTALSEMNVAALAPAVTDLFAALDEKEIESLTRELLASAAVLKDDQWVELFGAHPIFDLEMGGCALDTLKLVYFSIEVNYADFFGEFRGALAARAKAFASRGSNTSPKSGQGGDS